MSDEALMIFAKAPEPGRVKTRLGWPGHWAAELHSALNWIPFGLPLVTLNMPFGALPTRSAYTSDQASARARMDITFRHTRKSHHRVVILGTDSPSATTVRGCGV